MYRLRRTCAALAAVLPLSLAGAGLCAAPASAASCSGYTCHGYDYGGRCTDTKDAYKLAKVNDPLNPRTVAVVHNKYSSGCNSNWATATLTSAGYNDGDSMMVVITTHDSRGNLESMCSPGGPSNKGLLNEYCYSTRYRGSGTAWTDMVDGTNAAQASVYVYDLNGKQIASAEMDL